MSIHNLRRVLGSICGARDCIVGMKHAVFAEDLEVSAMSDSYVALGFKELDMFTDVVHSERGVWTKDFDKAFVKRFEERFLNKGLKVALEGYLNRRFKDVKIFDKGAVRDGRVFVEREGGRWVGKIGDEQDFVEVELKEVWGSFSLGQGHVMWAGNEQSGAVEFSAFYDQLHSFWDGVQYFGKSAWLDIFKDVMYKKEQCACQQKGTSSYSCRCELGDDKRVEFMAYSKYAK